MTWRLRVQHTTGYRYDTEVVSSYNEARLTPQTSPGQLTLESRVRTVPDAKQYRYWDYWGTQVTAFDVQQPHQELVVTGQSVVDTTAAVPAPDDGPGWADLRSPQQRDRHCEALSATPRTTPDPEMSAAAQEVAGDLPPREAVLAVTDLVHGRVAYQPGSTGVQTSAVEAWHLGRGVCQDIAHVSLALLRELGVPARYVSGYLHPDPDGEVNTTVTAESHAWIEVWLGDWWAFDPTNTIAAGARHVFVARGREYGDVTPLKGIYSGTGSHALGVTVELTRLA
jgi:transglutaminase-like putative cysteine protease